MGRDRLSRGAQPDPLGRRRTRRRTGCIHQATYQQHGLLEHLKAWLLRVAINRCHELHRAPWNSRVEAIDATDTLETSQNGPSPQMTDARAVYPANEVMDEVLGRLEANALWQAIGQLPEKLREVVLLHYIEDYPTHEIAHILGCSPTTVRTRLYRARRQIRSLLEETSNLRQADNYA